MESFCKIIITILLVVILTNPYGCSGQNIHNSTLMYYNMDTIRCVNKDIRFWEGGKLKNNLGNPDSAGLYCTFKKHIDIPIVTVNDDSIIHLIDSCVTDAERRDYLQFPDSSGYFIELLLSWGGRDSLMSMLTITPISNYYMAEALSSYRNEIFYEWYGCYEKNPHGVFFWGNILCVVTSYGCFDYKKASCLFPQTNDTLRLVLFSPIRMIVSDNTWSRLGHFFYNCDSVSMSNTKE